MPSRAEATMVFSVNWARRRSCVARAGGRRSTLFHTFSTGTPFAPTWGRRGIDWRARRRMATHPNPEVRIVEVSCDSALKKKVAWKEMIHRDRVQFHCDHSMMNAMVSVAGSPPTEAVDHMGRERWRTDTSSRICSTARIPDGPSPGNEE